MSELVTVKLYYFQRTESDKRPFTRDEMVFLSRSIRATKFPVCYLVSKENWGKSKNHFITPYCKGNRRFVSRIDRIFKVNYLYWVEVLLQSFQVKIWKRLEMQFCFWIELNNCWIQFSEMSSKHHCSIYDVLFITYNPKEHFSYSPNLQ